MSIKIIPREKVYFRDWVEKNGIDVEVRELEGGEYPAWTAAIANAVSEVDVTGHGNSPDAALEMLEKNLGRYASQLLQVSNGKQVPIPKFDKQTAADRDVKKNAEMIIKELERARKAWPYSPFPMYPGDQPMPMPHPYKAYDRKWGSTTLWSGEVKRPCGCTAPCRCMGS